MIIRTTCVIALIPALLSACGTNESPNNGAVATTNGTADLRRAGSGRSCEDLRSNVIRVAAENGVNIIKIYEPKTIKDEAKKIVCTGRALLGNGQVAPIYYRDHQDAGGDWLVEYNDKRLD